jgi:predicted nucleic acid-binding protein
MIVADASVVVEVLLASGLGLVAHPRLMQERKTLHAPHLLDLEVTHTLRRLERVGVMNAAHALQALTDYQGIGVHRHDHGRFLPRIWELRHVLTAYDAAYVALAEALDCPLVTTDARLAQSQGHTARIELIAAA